MHFQTSGKIKTLPALSYKISSLRFLGRKIVFTNGCFDILHLGHVEYLEQARSFGNILVVALNSDLSVKRLKGENRPVNNQEVRSRIIASLWFVDFVCLFEEDTPIEVIKTLKPDVLVKGADYSIEQIAGAKEVLAYGGSVELIQLTEGYSTTGLIKKLSC